jgi:hypothetical protein
MASIKSMFASAHAFEAMQRIQRQIEYTTLYGTRERNPMNSYSSPGFYTSAPKYPKANHSVTVRNNQTDTKATDLEPGEFGRVKGHLTRNGQVVQCVATNGNYKYYAVLNTGELLSNRQASSLTVDDTYEGDEVTVTVK